ncbi:alpha/beta fold hydrolase [Patulibacter minatonensis]|uniref:alpha/beta fold hydrolase n=1 Tax=Patulibacter minatonensis TaxID=298163 RepID=UPI00047AB134|nr:alpha/beta fold hydrolase [Patulibacter minatonensis]
MSRFLPRTIALVPALVALTVLAPSASAALPCGDQDLGRTRCSRVLVPLDRTGAVEGRVGLSVRTIQLGERRKKVRREGVLFLAGGPGQAATSLAADVAPILKPLLRRRDLVTVDTRGTGRSTDLIVCPELETSAVTGLSEPESFRSCARRLGPAVDRYGTADVVEDLEAVRRAGGYDKLLVVGVSYGTYTAQRYAAAHPDRVSGLILDSSVDPTGDDPFSLATFRALPRALDHACDRRACRGVTTDVAGDLARVQRALPLVTKVDDGKGRRRAARLDAPTVISLVQAGDLDPMLRAALPAALRRAGEGDPAPLGRLAREAGLLVLPEDDEDPAAGAASATSISTGSYVATVCRDTHQPWAAGTPIGAPRRNAAIAALDAVPSAARGGWVAGDLVDLTPSGICAEWPGTPDDLSVGPAPDVPTLVLSGEDDTRTSPEEARRVAARHPGTQLLSVPDQGHSVLGSGRGCVTTALKAFAAGRPLGRCHHPNALVKATPLAPSSPAGLGSTPAARARAVARATVLDAIRSALLASIGNLGDTLVLDADEQPTKVAGLRSGSATLSASGTLRLRRMGFVPGTSVTTVAAEQRRIRVQVRGTGLRPGTYSIPNPLVDAAAIYEALGVDPDSVDDLGLSVSRAVRRIAER